MTANLFGSCLFFLTIVSNTIQEHDIDINAKEAFSRTKYKSGNGREPTGLTISIDEDDERSSTLGEIVNFNFYSLSSLSLYPETCSVPRRICYGQLGCFESLKGPLKHLCRLPEEPSLIETKFYYFLKANESKKYLFNTRGMQRIPLDSDVVVLIHGNYESGLSPVYIELKDALFKYTHYSVVIVVDYLRGSALIDVMQTIVNTQLIGRQVAVTTEKLMKRRRINPRNIYIIGFSMGTMVSHYAAKWLNSTFGLKVGRITGLEMAALFTEGYSDTNLNMKDADFVDIIHTTGGHDKRYPSFSVLGMQRIGVTDPAGHVDFYPNGGNIQPQCFLASVLSWCSHVSAVNYFINSLTDCEFRSVSCNRVNIWDIDEPCKGRDERRERGSRMGYFSAFEPGRGAQFLRTTNLLEPYC